MTGLELVDITVVSVDYGGHPVPLETGRLLAHAVRGEHMAALCGQARRYLTPSGWPWADPQPENSSRCAACLQLHPL